MTNEQLNELQNIRNAIDDLYGKLDINLYEKVSAAKVSYNRVCLLYTSDAADE